jgi:hypothetical protein
MKIENQKLIDKRDSIIRLAEKVGVDANTIPFLYPRGKFDRTLTFDVAKGAFDLDMSKEHQKRLEEICNIPFNRDNRTATEYAIDLIYGWFVEDIFIEFLLANKFDVIRTGIDREREFLSSGRIKSDLDILVTHDSRSRYFDIYFDSSNYWQKTDKIDIRESKWKTIVKEDSSIICVSNAGFGIIDAESDYTLGPNSLWGGKTCATVLGIKDKLLSVDDFIIELKNTLRK